MNSACIGPSFEKFDPVIDELLFGCHTYLSNFCHQMFFIEHYHIKQAVIRMIKVASTNVKIDVILNQKCAEDISNFCSDFGPGNSKGGSQKHFKHVCYMKTLQ